MPFKFVYLCDLFESLEQLEAQNRDVPLFVHDKQRRYRQIITSWFHTHRRRIHDADTDRVALLSSLFPERRTDRVYSLQAATLLRVLSRCMGLGRERLERLQSWKPSSGADLGLWASRLMKSTDAGMLPSSLTVEDIDHALGRIAAQCRFSGPRIRSSHSLSAKRPVHELLRPIVTKLSSVELKWLVRLVLKNFSPIMLDEDLVLSQIHHLLPRILKFQCDFESAIRIVDSPKMQNARIPGSHHDAEYIRKLTSECLRPIVGVKVGRPTFVKARSVKHCLKIAKNLRWAVEPKYDGEYCQVHVDLSRGDDCIQIFAKSGKDATKDRCGLQDWIKVSLKIGSRSCKFQKECILEGELLVYDDEDKSILEFHKIRKHVLRSGRSLGTEQDSQAHPNEHLMLVFYDALLIDDDVVMVQPYETRRQKLRQIIQYFPGWTQTADWGTLDFSRISLSRASRKLEEIFAKAIAMRCEGLILKPCHSPYFSITEPLEDSMKIIKLKKDYIPGLGDGADLVVVGASCDSREETVAGSKWTNFALACLVNKIEVLRIGEKPTFVVLGHVARPCMSVDDMLHLSELGSFMELPFTESIRCRNYSLSSSTPALNPEVLFTTPFIVEVLGSGFHKPASSNSYMLRHPRIVKVHSDRDYHDIVSFDELQKMAQEAVSLPDDIVREETQWLKHLETLRKSKRSEHICDSSPFSESTSRSGGSSLAIPTRPRHAATLQPPLIRIDSSELFPRENRFASAEQSVSSMAVVPSNLDGLGSNTKAGPSKRPLAELRNSPSKRTRAELGDMLPANGQDSLSKDHRTLLPSSVSSDEPKALFNTAPSHVTNSEGKTRKIAREKDCVGHPSGKSFASTSQSTIGTARSSSHQPYQYRVRPTGNSAPSPSRSAQPSNPNTQPSRLSVFRNHAIYISPCISHMPYLTEDLLPQLEPADVTSNVTHWSRELQNLPPLGWTVSESQAFPGLQKSVLVESRRTKQADEVVGKVKALTLAADESVLFWDWRVVEDLTGILNAERALRDNDDEQMLLRWWRGCVRWDETRSANIWTCNEDLGREIARRMIGEGD